MAAKGEAGEHGEWGPEGPPNSVGDPRGVGGHSTGPGPPRGPRNGREGAFSAHEARDEEPLRAEGGGERGPVGRPNSVGDPRGVGGHSTGSGPLLGPQSGREGAPPADKAMEEDLHIGRKPLATPRGKSYSQDMTPPRCGTWRQKLRGCRGISAQHRNIPPGHASPWHHTAAATTLHAVGGPRLPRAVLPCLQRHGREGGQLDPSPPIAGVPAGPGTQSGLGPGSERFYEKGTGTAVHAGTAWREGQPTGRPRSWEELKPRERMRLLLAHVPPGTGAQACTPGVKGMSREVWTKKFVQETLTCPDAPAGKGWD